MTENADLNTLPDAAPDAEAPWDEAPPAPDPDVVDAAFENSLPPEDATESESDAPKKAAKSSPPASPTKMNLTVWTKISGKKEDQVAPFRQWAKARKLAPRTAPEWSALFDEFLSRPV